MLFGIYVKVFEFLTLTSLARDLGIGNYLEYF